MPTIYYKSGSSWINASLANYPIGSVYMSKSATSPSTLFGGTWSEITGAVLRANKQAGVYSDSDTHTLTIDEMPNHTHGVHYSMSGANWSLPTNLGNWYVIDAKYPWVHDNTPIVSVGGGQAHTTKQRAYNVYAWVRTA